MGAGKGIRFDPWYRAQKEGRLLPPVQACVNPVHGCNLSCLCCEFAPDEGELKEEMTMMERGHMARLVDFLVDWGVKSVVFGTVGEATLHRELPAAIERAAVGGLDVAVITNGVYVQPELAHAIGACCSTLWVKIPAATPEVYELVTRKRHISKVREMVGVLGEHGRGKGLKVGWLFEMVTLNMDEVVEACKLAKEKRFDMFLARPLPSGSYGKRMDAEGFTQGITDEFVAEMRVLCAAVGNGKFGVRVEGRGGGLGYHQCYAAPLTIHLGADGNVFFCHDRYGEPEMFLGRHWPDPRQILEMWGGEKHQDLLRGDTPYWCRATCSLGEYHEIAHALAWEGDDPLRRWQIIR